MIHIGRQSILCGGHIRRRRASAKITHIAWQSMPKAGATAGVRPERPRGDVSAVNLVWPLPFLVMFLA
jgi:hypothetical protein